MKLSKGQKQTLGKYVGYTWKDKTDTEWYTILGVNKEEANGKFKQYVQDFLRKLKRGISCCYVGGRQRQNMTEVINLTKEINKKRAEKFRAIKKNK